MRKFTKFAGVVGVAALMVTAAVSPVMADTTVGSSITGGTLTQTSAAPSMSGLTLDGTTLTSTGTSAAWTVVDARGSGAVWTVSVSASLPTSAVGTGDGNTTARTLPAGKMTITTGAVTAGTDSDSAAGITGSTALVLSTTAQAVLTATADHKGSYSQVPTFNVTYPANAYKSNFVTGSSGDLVPYVSTITVTIA